MNQFLETSHYIDWNVSVVLERATIISAGLHSEDDIVRSCFEFVRDEIKHSFDHKIDPVTCKASDVLRFGTGYCFAKSHLLAALLRAKGIPAGLCYQRLGNGNGHCLHGLNAVFLSKHGWYRIDPRGNKVGVCSEFSPPQENLSFTASGPGEADLQEIWATPLTSVVEALEKSSTYLEVARNLPDMEVPHLRQ